jgi:hypothetical protein
MVRGAAQDDGGNSDANALIESDHRTIFYKSGKLEKFIRRIETPASRQ